MKLYLPILLFLISFNFSFSQSSIDLKNAEQYYSSGNYVQAIELYEKALITEPNNSYIYGQIAFSYLFLKKYEQSKLKFDEAININSKIADYYNGKGLAEAYLGDVNSAISDFTKAIDLDSKFSHAYLNRGSAYTSMGNNDGAISDLKVAEKLDPQNPEINYQLARLLYKKNEYSKSVEQYNIAEKKGLKTIDLYLSRATVFYKNNDIKSAIKDYTSILSKDSKNTDALNNRAVMYDYLGKNDLADKDRKTLYKITGVEFKDPKNYKYINTKSKNKYFSVNLPDHWEVEHSSKDNEDRMEITVPQKNSNPRYKAVKITLSYNFDMQNKFGISDENELVNFWQQSQIKNTKNYVEYDLLSQKQFMLNGWKAINFITASQATTNSFKINMYELVASKPDQLFYGYFQSASEDFKYYQPIFEKILKTINIKGK